MSAAAALDAEIRRAAGGADLAAARAVFREYGAWLPAEWRPRNYEAETASLPGRYGPPSGLLLIARVAGEAAGIAAVRPLDDGACEMKRLFVREAFRRRGLGRALALRTVGDARAFGYSVLRLKTLESMTEAQALYESLGFRPISSYGKSGRAGLLSFELELAAP